jgi:uncharacterized OsmC-like protein
MIAAQKNAERVTDAERVTNAERINGVNLPALRKLVEDGKRDAAGAMTRWGVTTRWVEGAVSETQVDACQVGRKQVRRDFSIRIDEPLELAGTNTAANPQEHLLAAFNACMVVGYVALASLQGVELESVEIESAGEIDLRGFLGISAEAKPGYDQIHYTVRVKGNGTPEQFEQIHRTVMATSPNRFNIASPIRLTSELVVG